MVAASQGGRGWVESQLQPLESQWCFTSQHMEAKHSLRITLAVVGMDISTSRYKKVHLVPSFSFYKILL